LCGKPAGKSGMSENLAAVRKMSGQCRGKILSGKQLIANFLFRTTPVFSRLLQARGLVSPVFGFYCWVLIKSLWIFL